MQQIRYVGFLHSGHKQNFVGPLASLKSQLPNDVELIEIWGEDDIGMLTDGAAELIRNPDALVVVAAGGPGPALRLQAQSKEQGIAKPIVFTTVANPVVSGLVSTEEKPGHNLTGMAGKTSELDAARLVLLHALTGGGVGSKFGVLRFENRDHGNEQYREIVGQAKQIGIDLVPKRANTRRGIERAFDHFAKEKVKGVVVTADSFFNNHRADVTAIAAAKNLPAIYQWKEFVDDGGLISYGPSILEAYRMAGEYVTRILQQKMSPSDIPVSKPSAFSLHMNIMMAQQHGITPPATLNGEHVRLI